MNRFNFLIESMNDLSRSLTRLNNESKLLVVRGSPYTLLPELWKTWGITHLVYEIVRQNTSSFPCFGCDLALFIRTLVGTPRNAINVFESWPQRLA